VATKAHAIAELNPGETVSVKVDDFYVKRNDHRYAPQKNSFIDPRSKKNQVLIYD
jgi:hypothetical protein